MNEQKSILAIDDDEALCNALDTKFSRKGYNVTVCKDGNEALKALENQKFDVVLTDLHMPNKDGFAVLELMKKTMNVETPAYVITNLGTEQYCDKAIELGAKKCFIKSIVTLRDVVNVVDSELEAKQ